MPERISIPKNLRNANLKDFYDKNMNPKIGMKFFILSYHSREFEPHELHFGMDVVKWYPWIKDSHAFVEIESKEEKKPEKKEDPPQQTIVPLFEL